MNTARPLLAALSLLFLASPAWAYNFLYIHPTTGEPIKWDNTQTIQYYLDPGKLGRLTNEQAHTLLKEAMKIWENSSPNANPPQFEFAGYLPEDVDETNYENYVSLFPCYTDDLSSCESNTQKNLQTVIIFDEDGSILDNELCRITSCSASSGTKVFSGNISNPINIAQGIMVLGPDVVLSNVNLHTLIPSIVGIMTHELGHLLGLAHSIINQETYVNADVESNFTLPTMFSGFISGVYSSGDRDGITLNPDDVAGISTLYPSTDFSVQTATIKGKILKSDGSPMMHVNVIARNVNDPLCEAYSFLTGRFCPHDPTIQSLCTNEDGTINQDGTSASDGTFTLTGLPSGTYSLEVEEVADDSLGQILAPGLIPSEDIYGDAEFWNDSDIASEDNLTVSTITLVAGETRGDVDIILNRSETTNDRIQYIPLNTFIDGTGNSCQPSTTDYAGLIGVTDSSDSSSESTPLQSSGCTLVRP